MKSPLEGLRVLDLSRAMSGPYATMLLGDYGADVIKVEEPTKGDETRYWYPPKIGEQSAYFLSANRNKRGITLDLKSPEGLEVFHRLVRVSDIVVENFRPGVTAKLKVDYESTKKINPRVIYCSISGFGQTGPYRELPGYDLAVFAMGGIMSFTGEEGRSPIRLSIPIADLSSGLVAVTAILAALNYRSVTGEGQYVDVSMQDVQVSLLTHQGMNYFATGENPKRIGSMHPNLVPYGAFRASDSYFVLAVGNDKLWSDFCREIGRVDLSSDARFKTNPDRVGRRDFLNAILSDIFRGRSADEWVELARKAGVPAARILDVSEVVADPHVLSRGMIKEVRDRSGTTIKQIGAPAKFSSLETPIRSAPPHLGEHTDEVLRELGYSEEGIAGLHTRKVV